MSTSYYDLKYPLGAVMVSDESPTHVTIEVFDNAGGHNGTLRAQGQHKLDLLRMFFNDDPVARRVGVGNGQTQVHVLRPMRGRVVMSEYGEIIRYPYIDYGSVSPAPHDFHWNDVSVMRNGITGVWRHERTVDQGR